MIHHQPLLLQKFGYLIRFLNFSCLDKRGPILIQVHILLESLFPDLLVAQQLRQGYLKYNYLVIRVHLDVLIKFVLILCSKHLANINPLHLRKLWRVVHEHEPRLLFI